MAHYALLNDNNVVIDVITGRDEGELGIDWEDWYGRRMGFKCLRTSYNTHGGKHLLGGTPFRKNYAGVGYTYDPELDAFLLPQPFPSWVLDKETGWWHAPVPLPPYSGTPYQWDEATLSWVPFTPKGE